ncbi:MAG: hypothetical protein M0T84_01680 [Betaproteobacteria bacterium]|nr:hypothetical protein [Betaproteobacteria bacterium]
MAYAYSNNGMTFRAWNNPTDLLPGEVYFTSQPNTAQFAATFPGYAAALASHQSGDQYNQWIGRGLTLTCASTPAINGTYAINAGSQHTIALEAQFVSTFSEFTTGGAVDLPWQLANGQFVVFPTTSLFLAFAKAVAMTVAAAKLAIAQISTGQSAALPINIISLP